MKTELDAAMRRGQGVANTITMETMRRGKRGLQHDAHARHPSVIFGLR